MEKILPGWEAKEVRKNPVVFVSGCYDLLHTGHVAFFEQASKLGDLYVSLGNDENIKKLKHHDTMFPNEERQYMVQSIRYVKWARVCSGFGKLDFAEDLDKIQPDIFFVNEDGHSDDKKKLCESKGIKYVIGERKPRDGLEARSSTSIKAGLKHS